MSKTFQEEALDIIRDPTTNNDNVDERMDELWVRWQKRWAKQRADAVEKLKNRLKEIENE